MADPQIDLHEALAAAENKARIAYEDWRASSNRDAYVADLARRAARTAVLAAAPFLVQQGRQQAADAILAHADKHAPRDGHIALTRRTTLRRHLDIAARVAAGPMSMEQVTEAIQAGNYAGCHLDEAGQSIPPAVPDGTETGQMEAHR